MISKQEQIAITKYDLLFEQRLSRNETICEQLSNDMKEMKNDMKEIRHDMKEIRHDTRSDFRWMMGIFVAFNTTLLGVIAKGFHWI